MLPDCIDPGAGDLLREIASKPVSEYMAAHSGDYLEELQRLLDARSHWHSCPACRREFTSMPEIIRKLGLELQHELENGLELENRLSTLAEVAEDRDHHKRSLLSRRSKSPDASIDVIVRLLEVYEEVEQVLATANHLNLRPLSSQPAESREFFPSLGPRLQQFVYAARYCSSMLAPIYEKVRLNYPSSGELRLRLRTAIVESGLEPCSFVATLVVAASAAVLGYAKTSTSETSIALANKPDKSLAPEERTIAQGFLQEWKQDFDNAFDSLKASQMETIRLIERNQRSATAYEADIEAQLGASLYSQLSDMTQRALQVAEYEYHKNQEPNYFHASVARMARAYENELSIRVIWPFVNELQAAGEETYDAKGESREPLLRGGNVPSRCMMLGNLAWYLRKDAVMRNRIAALGFDAEAIAKDAALVSSLRNKAAHEDVCERAVADDLRRRMLCRDGIFSRLHPMVGGNRAD